MMSDFANLYKERIDNLRDVLNRNNIDYYIVYTSDPHMSEYVSDADKYREYLSGFSGSAGTLVVSKKEALLWTDGRYFVQAKKQLAGSDIQLMKSGEAGVPTLSQYIAQNVKSNMTVATDGAYISEYEAESLLKAAPEGAIFDFKNYGYEMLWQEKPQRVFNPVREVNTKYSGKGRKDKLSYIRDVLSKREKPAKNKYAYISAELCNNMWILNLRGDDIKYVPVAYSYLYLDESRTILFADEASISDEIMKSLASDSVDVYDYRCFYDFVNDLKQYNVYLDKETSNYRIIEELSKENTCINYSCYGLAPRHIKNDTELKWMRYHHISDAVAMVKAIRTIKESVSAGKKLTESDAGRIVDNFRLNASDCEGLSFETISAYGGNAAVVHYSANEKTALELEEKGFYLVDSGSQYPGCTSDITRTIALGPLTEEERINYTAVLKGNLRLLDATFMEGATGENLDILAREPIWESGLDYRHGTGHGIGCNLSVHESIPSVRYRYSTRNIQPKLCEGMIISDEPGIYIEGKYGIRLENQLEVIQKEENEWGKFLGFESLTMVPFERDAIIKENLTERELEVLNKYHQKVREKLIVALEDEKDRRWVIDATENL